MSRRWMLFACGMLFAVTSCQAQTPWLAVVSPDDAYNLSFLKDGKPVLKTSMVGWGPKWGWRSFGAKGLGKGEDLTITAPFEADKAAGMVIDCTLHATRPSANQIQLAYHLKAAKDCALTEFVVALATEPAFRDGRCTVTLADGKTADYPLAFNQVAGTEPITKAVFASKSAGDITMAVDPPVGLHIDNGMRVLLAKDTFPAGEKTITLTLTFPGAITFVASEEAMRQYIVTVPGDDWFAWKATSDVGPSALGFEEWLDKPAGKHGGVRMVKDRFQFADGTPVKFFGTNLSYAGSAPSKPDATFMAKRFAKWGVNAVRMHKFTGQMGWEGIGDKNDCTKMDPAGLDKLDNFCSELTKNGVYYGWSHTFGLRVRPGNKGQLLAYDEIMSSEKDGNTYALINLAEDVQDLMIAMVTGLLKHTNPYTGKPYSQDPALAYLELQNEDDIFFYTNQGAIDRCPTYKKHFTERWSDWLKAKYGTTAALKQAWGDALAGNETLEARNIALQGNPWFYGADHLPGQTGGQRQRLLDNAAHLHQLQNSYYQRFVKAIRDAGYQGPLCGSPWQAPGMLPHYLNLKSDYDVGWIDRHNYFGGALKDTMLKSPGSGFFSSGLQQVADRPFGLSEWIDVYPSLYSADGPAILAAYGMGLQGWDSSYEFQSDSGGRAFSDIAGNMPNGVWRVDTPSQIGQYPLLARMVMRGDVKEGEIVSTRRVSADDLAKGTFNFSDTVRQQGDVKTFTGSVPAEALAIGRCVVEFGDKPAPSTFVDPAKYTRDGTLTSSTGELAWNGTGGWFTVNTAGTKAVVGFAPGQEFKLGGFSLQLDCPYASLFLTAANRSQDLSNADRALVSLVARNSNAGFTVFSVDNRVLENGKAPLLVEPAKATLTSARRQLASVQVLDHDGKRSGKTLPVNGGKVVLDETADKTIYYEVVFAK